MIKYLMQGGGRVDEPPHHIVSFIMKSCDRQVSLGLQKYRGFGLKACEGAWVGRLEAKMLWKTSLSAYALY